MTSAVTDFPAIARKYKRMEQKAEWDRQNPPPPDWYNLTVCWPADAAIGWIEDYHIGVDSVLGSPVLKPFPASLLKAIEKGHVREISEDRASELNMRFLKNGDFARAYLLDHLRARQAVINSRIADPA